MAEIFRSLFVLVSISLLSFSDSFGQNCPPPEINQELYVFPYQAHYSMLLTGASSGLAQYVLQGESFDTPNNVAIYQGKIYFGPLIPNTSYEWRARSNCSAGGDSDWTPVYSFTTPPPCPPTLVLPLDSVINLSFPAPQDPNIGYINCSPTEGAGYVFDFTTPTIGNYRLSVLDASGASVKTGVSYSGNYCRGSLACLNNTSPAGSYSNFPSQNAADHLTFAFSTAPGSAPATRSFKISYAPCPSPTLLKFDTIKPDFAKVRFNVQGDIEIIPATDTFTGVPNYINSAGLEYLVNLTPGTDYRWQVRGNCGGHFSNWVEGPGFTTSYPCDGIPFLQCDSFYSAGFQAGYGRHRMFRYKPPMSHELFLTTTPFDSVYHDGIDIALRDSALGDCFSQDWYVELWPFFTYSAFVSNTKSLGYLYKDTTYYIYANKSNVEALPLGLQWDCQGNCPPPGLIKTKATSASMVQLDWHDNGATTDWEIEMRTDSMQFSGMPQFSGNGDSYTASGLTSNTWYYWRVRSVCPGPGAGVWSAMYRFRTPADCANAPALTCETFVAAYNSESLSLLNSCPNSEQGAENFYTLTPAFDGEFRLKAYANGPARIAFKLLDANCGHDTGWVCVGAISPLQEKTFSLGTLTGGQTYLIAVDFPAFSAYPDMNVAIQINCPPLCPKPTGLMNSGLVGTSINLNWAAGANHDSWEIEVIPNGAAFSGIANYSSDQNNLAVTGLMEHSPYKWRVRGICGAFTQSDWSDASVFTTQPDCMAHPLLDCEEVVKLQFPSGNGYWSNLATCGLGQNGKEKILQFTSDGSNRYVFLPDGVASFGVYLKNGSNNNCNSTSGWQCVGYGGNTPFFTLDNLTAGDTYFLLFKKQNNAPADSLLLSFHCDLPCPAPYEIKTAFNPDGTIIRAFWKGWGGPWKHEIAMRYPDGSELKQIVPWVYSGQNLLSWFSIPTNEIYSWRIRTICDNGDVSDWSPYQHFRLPLCNGAPILPCNDTLPATNDALNRYTYYDVCTKTTALGQQRMYFLRSRPGGEITLHLIAGSNTPLQYSVSEKLGTNCGNPSVWSSCGSVVGDTVLNLGNLAFGDYLIQFSTEDTIPISPFIETICPCLEPSKAEGVLFSNGSALLTWKKNFYALSNTEIEVVPLSQAFSGVPNYFKQGDSLIIDGLDISQTYQFRVRSLCGDINKSAWTQTFPITLMDCNKLDTLSCNEKLTILGGPGLMNFYPCGQSATGIEVFFKVVPEYTGTYHLELIEPPFTNSKLYLSLLSPCDRPGGALTCIAGNLNNYNLGYLYAGQTYVIMADQSFSSGVTFEIILRCTIGNDWPSQVWPESPTKNFFITVGDTCQLFTNVNASGSSGPDPSIPPGNWYDGPEHTVWFGFFAPPSGEPFKLQ